MRNGINETIYTQVTIFIQGLYPFELFKFDDFFHDLFQFSMALVLAFTFKNFQNYSCFW